MWKKLIIINFILLIYIIYHTSQINFTFPSCHYISSFPTAKQPDSISCGPTSAYMLLKYYNIPSSIEDLKSKAKTKWFTYKERTIGLTIPSQLRDAIESSGLHVKLKQGTINELKHYISKNQPPIILIRSSERTWHYVVAMSYDEDSIVISDPADANYYKIPTKELENAWKFVGDLHGGYYGRDFYFAMVYMAEVQNYSCIIPKFN